MYCEKCGTPMMPVYSRRKGWGEVCIKCGKVMKTEAVSNLEQTAAEHAYRGWNYFAVQNFDAAAEGFREAAELSGGWPEYLWAELLAEYGIKYCETEHRKDGGQYTVNFWKKELSEKLLAENAEFKAVCNAAASGDLEDLRYYQNAAEDIDRGLEQIRQVRSEGIEYDIFISFKDLDSRGEHTLERKLCDKLYQELKEFNYRVFYSPRTMYGKVVTDYEGYIYTALRTSKLMVLAASCPENVRSPWVKSEWQRFLRWNAGENYRLITCTVGDMQPGEYPEGLNRFQHNLHVREDQINEIAIRWFSSEIEKRYLKLPQKQEKTEKVTQRAHNDADEQLIDIQMEEEENKEITIQCITSSREKKERKEKHLLQAEGGQIVERTYKQSMEKPNEDRSKLSPGFFTLIPGEAKKNVSDSTSLIQVSMPKPFVFADMKVEGIIRKVLERPLGNIYTSDLVQITSLNLQGSEVSNIQDLSALTNLKYLNLSINKISDISPLSKLTDLKTLNLFCNNVSDISPLSSLTDLMKLDLFGNNISDITPISNLTNLMWLSLGYNTMISDISALSNLTELTRLYLSFNDICDISPLSNLTGLIELYLSHNSISDISPLSNLTGLMELCLSHNNIRDINLLSDLTNVTELYLDNNNIFDQPIKKNKQNIRKNHLQRGIGQKQKRFSAGKSHFTRRNRRPSTNMPTVSPHASASTPYKFVDAIIEETIRNTLGKPIEDLFAFDLAKITSLDLHNRGVSDIRDLSLLINLEELDMSGNSIRDISPLSNLKNLTSLYLHMNSISDISPLSNLTNLTTLSLANNSISDIGALAGLKSLKYLSLYNNCIHDRKPLAHLLAKIHW